MEIRLDDRLSALAELVGEARQVADIGADHGRLALSLLQAQSDRRVLVSDISAASLDKARRLLLGAPERERTVFVVADGLDALSAMPDTDAIVIAGMGARLIQRILSQGKEKIGGAALCLQPSRDAHFLRAWLQENCFALEAEKLVHAAGRYYVLLKARHGLRTCYTEKELFLGPLLCTQKPTLFAEYLSWRRDVLCYALQGLQQGTRKSVERQEEEIDRQLRWIKEELR